MVASNDKTQDTNAIADIQNTNIKTDVPHWNVKQAKTT